MSDDILVPQSTTEEFLGALTGDYTGELPSPSSRVEKYLAKLAKAIVRGCKYRTVWGKTRLLGEGLSATQNRRIAYGQYK